MSKTFVALVNCVVEKEVTVKARDFDAAKRKLEKGQWATEKEIAMNTYDIGDILEKDSEK